MPTRPAHPPPPITPRPFWEDAVEAAATVAGALAGGAVAAVIAPPLRAAESVWTFVSWRQTPTDPHEDAHGAAGRPERSTP